MIEQAFQWIANQAERVYDLDRGAKGLLIDGKEMKIIQEPTTGLYLKQKSFTTLEGLVEFLVRDKIDPKSYYIHVKYADKVEVFSKPDDYKNRETPAVAGPFMDSFDNFRAGEWYNLEEMIITLKAGFETTDDLPKLVQVLGTVTNKMLETKEDDGVSQTTTVSAGVTGNIPVDLPQFVRLAPYRSFPEITQPESTYFLRMRRGRGNEAEVALFLADAGKWRIRAIEGIRDQIKELLSKAEVTGFPIIS